MSEVSKNSALSKYFNNNDHEKVSLLWDNISYNILVPDENNSKIMKARKILQNLKGKAESGDLLAILGPTGCGKTSLLNVLAGRFPIGGSKLSKLTGEITINGKTRNDEVFRNMSAYVQQDDHIFAYLTVLETLNLAAHFYLPVDMSSNDKAELVEAVISELGLGKTRNTIIGNETIRGISGGERKRACIAIQLISNPSVLFLDEPTSGLDSFQALSVMEAMKNLSSKGRLVITVIHQPRSSIYGMFDKMLILSEGRTMYFGNASDTCVNYFADLGYVCPESFNPADFYLDLLSLDVRTPESEIETRKRINYLGDTWGEKNELISTIEFINTENINDLKHQKHLINIVKLYNDFCILSWRTWVSQARDTSALKIKIISNIFFGFIVGLIYSELDFGQRSIQDRIGLLFFISINTGFNSLLSVLNNFPIEKDIVNRERSDGAYHVLSYFPAKFLVEIPLIILPTILYACIVYLLVNLNPDGFYNLISILILESLVSVSLGLCVSAVSPNIEIANALGPPFLVIAILFGGFYINIESLPIIADLIPYFSFLKWSFEALAINEFSGLTFECNGFGGNSTCTDTGEAALSNLSFGDHSLGYPVFGLACLLIAFMSAACLILTLTNLKYITLGHEGSKYKKVSEEILTINSDEKEIELSYVNV
jgi:ABC-type multidrug transport system ATPase subunit